MDTRLYAAVPINLIHAEKREKWGRGTRIVKKFNFRKHRSMNEKSGGSKVRTISENSPGTRTERFAHVGSTVISRSTIAEKSIVQSLKGKLRTSSVRCASCTLLRNCVYKKYQCVFTNIQEKYNSGRLTFLS